MECGRSLSSVLPCANFGYFKHNLFKKIYFLSKSLNWLGTLVLILIDNKCDSLFLDSVFCSVYLFALFCALTYYPDFYSLPSYLFFAIPLQSRGILVALGIRSPPHLEDWSLNHWTTGTSLMSSLEKLFIFSKIVVVILDPFISLQILELACQFCQYRTIWDLMVITLNL